MLLTFPPLLIVQKAAKYLDYFLIVVTFVPLMAMVNLHMFYRSIWREKKEGAKGQAISMGVWSMGIRSSSKEGKGSKGEERSWKRTGSWEREKLSYGERSEVEKRENRLLEGDDIYI